MRKSLKILALHCWVEVLWQAILWSPHWLAYGEVRGERNYWYERKLHRWLWRRALDAHKSLAALAGSRAVVPSERR